ncbi:MAG TPA: hypothetical protein VLI55_04570 [Bryobacteraceae bacterium]|nr:hypothetical protein [Bryobacteraceae bacterium]
MGYNLVLLNLADRDEHGLVAKTARSIKVKRPEKNVLVSVFCGQNTVTEIPLFGLMNKLKGAGGASLERSDAELKQARDRCSRADKIMLCMHGLHNNVTHGYASDTIGTAATAVADYNQIADLMLSVLPAADTTYNLALIMCYGARSENFRLDHQGNIASGDLKSSFAYQFYRRICLFRNVRMTARTGATGFDTHTGRSMVETEASVLAHADQEEYLRLGESQAIIDNYKRLKDSYTKAASGGSEERAGRFLAMDTKFRQNPDAPTVSGPEVMIKSYAQLLRRKEGYQNIISANGDRSKYGKYGYTYENSLLTIFAKYPEPGVVLHSGGLL